MTREETPVAADLVRVSAGGRRVSLTLVLPELLPMYAGALGLSLRSSATLRALQVLTPERLAQVPLPRGVRRVTVIAIRVRRPNGSRTELRAFDALDASHDAAARRSGYVDRATIRLEFGERLIDVFVQLPHRVEFSDMAAEFVGPAREVLASIGVFDPGVVPDDARSLAPYVHGDWRWIDVLTDAGFAWLVAQKRLVREIAAHVATEEHRMHGAGYVVREVPGEPGVEYALAEDRSLGARLVGKKDRMAWRLDLAALAAAMRADLGSVEVGKPLAIDVEGVLDLGVVTLPSGKLRFVYAMGTPPKGWVGIAARACGIGVTLVVLVPRGHGQSELDGVTVIELEVGEQFGVRRIGRALGRAAEALGVGGEVEAWRLYDEEVIVDAKTSRVWIQGVLVPLTEKPYRFVEYLVKKAGHVSTTREIGEYVSSSEYPDVAARKTKGEVEKQVAAAMEGAGVDGAGIVGRLIAVEGRSGYRLGVGGRVV